MPKILQSHNFIRFVINQKNQKNYLENGGGNMRRSQIFKDENKNFFEKIINFLEEQEKDENQKEQNVIEEKNQKEEKDNFEFQKDFLAKEYDSALSEFNLSYAKILKQKMDNMKDDVWWNFASLHFKWALGCFVCFSVCVFNKNKHEKRTKIYFDDKHLNRVYGRDQKLWL